MIGVVNITGAQDIHDQPAHDRGQIPDTAYSFGIVHAGGAHDTNGAAHMVRHPVTAQDYSEGPQGLMAVFPSDVDRQFIGIRGVR